MDRIRAWDRADEGEYRNLALVSHGVLADVPLHDVWRVFLPDRGLPCSMIAVRRTATALIKDGSIGVGVKALFSLRRAAGKLFGWDRLPVRSTVTDIRSRVPREVLNASLVPPGTQDGPFSVVFVTEREALSEVRNVTVEAFLVWALRELPTGHDLWWAIHVRPVSRWTRPYLTLIAPFRRFIVYPSILQRFHEEWGRS